MFDFEKYKEKQRMSGAKNAYEPWTEDEDRALAEEFLAHHKLTEMAKAHGRTRGAIKTRLTRLGFLDREGKAVRPVSNE